MLPLSLVGIADSHAAFLSYRAVAATAAVIWLVSQLDPNWICLNYQNTRCMANSSVSPPGILLF